ncbi:MULTISPECIES: methyltransferase domain-containing protein [Hyphomicrobiales]|uniref:methyltransferase domain-containing protein n=1 Tax=Methylobacterium sp. CCH7-A2 TaxID=1768789 RepID=UPI000A84A161|nr:MULTISPECIES: methyltransferase domain-containing protein [Hyphomicrobiales]
MSIVQPSPEAARTGPTCPVCGLHASSWLCRASDYDVWRCASCATDFVNPEPTPEQLKDLYDREDWFEGGEHGGYASYDAQTDSSPPWLVALIERIDSERASPSILDIGCAYGTHLALARSRGWGCFGVEPSRHARDIAIARHPEIYFTETLEEIPPHRFDLILLLDVIEHLSEPYGLFYELMGKGAIGHDTVVAVTTPNARSAEALKDPGGWKYRHPPSHLTFYSGESFATLFRRLRFPKVEVTGQHPLRSSDVAAPFDDETSELNASVVSQEGLLAIASGSDFAAFMQERYVPGTWSEIAAYEHRPRYAFASSLAAGKRVLDFGCGSGYGAADLAEEAAHVTAVDISEEALAYAREHHKAPNLVFERRYDLAECLEPASFDLITCFELVEHLARPDQLRLLASLKRLLTEDGLLLISTPNPAATANYGENPFHLHEMPEAQFRATLTAAFPAVRFLGQVIAPAVTFLPDGADAQTTFSYRAISGDERPEPAVFMAVCGTKPLATLPRPIFLDSELDYVTMRTEAIKGRNRELLGRYEIHQLKVAVARRAEADAQARHETERKLIARETELSTVQSELSTVRADMARALEYWTAEAESNRVEREVLANRLRTIETSTSWRVITRLMPVLQLARPILRSMATAARRLTAAERRQRHSQNGETPAAVTKPSLDLAFETSRVPEWHESEGRYRLRLDEEMLLKRRTVPADKAGLIAPYEVAPLRPIPPNIRRPRILHVIPNVFVGGSTQLIIDIIQHLSHHYQQEVLTSALWRGGEHVGMTVHCVTQPNADSIRDVYRLYSPDIIHVHYWGLSDDPWYKAAFDALDAIPDAKVVENVNTPVTPMVVPRVDHYVFVSEYVRTQFGSAAADPAVSSIIYPGIDLSHFSKRYDGDDAKNAIGMVYRLESDKLREDAIDLFIEVIKRRPRTHAIIVGGGSFLEGYIGRTIAAGVRDNFYFTGYVPYDALPDLYDKFSVFVAPVWKESFGQVSPFAMAKGLAVAGYDVGALSEIIGRSDSFATELQDTACIIVDLLNTPERLAEAGERNRVRAATMFAVETMVERYDALYAMLLSARAR